MFGSGKPKGYESPAEADERRSLELEACRNCKRSVDGFTWDRLGGYCPHCQRTMGKDKDKEKGRRKRWL